MEELNLFDRGTEVPLAERLRPQTLDEFAGQSIFSERIRSFACLSKATESRR